MPDLSASESHPASAPPAARLRHGVAVAGAALLVVALCALMQLWGLGRAPFHTKGEPREALVVWEMVHGGGWILPRRNGIELPSKPPFFHWLAAAASLVTGEVSELSCRVPSALQSGAAALIVLLVGARLWSTRVGLMAALVLLTSFEWQRTATSARVDMTLTFGLTAAFAALLLLRSGAGAIWVAVFYGGAAWAVLAKGPVGVALPALQVLAISVADRSTALLRRTRPLLGLCCLLLVAGAWYAAAAYVGGREFVERQILFENVSRFVGRRDYAGGHHHSALYLLRELATGMLPWTLLLPFALHRLAERPPRAPGRDGRIFCLLWAVVVFAFYSLPASKRGVYLLPLYPAVALLLAAGCDAAIRARRPLPRLRFLTVAVTAVLGAACAALSLVSFAQWAGAPLFESIAAELDATAREQALQLGRWVSAEGPRLGLLLATGALAAFTARAASSHARWGTVFTCMVLASAAVSMSVQQVILPAVAEAKSRRHYAAALRRGLPEGVTLSSYGRFDYGTVFYWRERMPVYRGALRPEAPEYLLMTDTTWRQLDAPDRALYEPLPGLRSARGGNLGRLLLVHRTTGRR